MEKILTEKSVLSENGQTFYWVSHTNKEVTIVFLPGLTANHTLFEKQITYFYDKYNVIVWDCPCHGSRFDIEGNPIMAPSNHKIKEK